MYKTLQADILLGRSKLAKQKRTGHEGNGGMLEKSKPPFPNHLFMTKCFVWLIQTYTPIALWLILI